MTREDGELPHESESDPTEWGNSDGFGRWPSADEVARIGGPTGPIIPDGGDETFPGDVDDLPRALRRRVETTLAADEPVEAFLAHAWTAHRDLPTVEALADAARFECLRRELEIEPVAIEPELRLPRETWERIWYRYLDALHNGDDHEIGDLVHDYVEIHPTFIVPADPETGEEEIVVNMGEWPVVPRYPGGEPLDTDPDGQTRGETR